MGGAEIIKRVVNELRDENETYREIVIRTIEQIITQLGAADIDKKLEDSLMEGLLYCFQE